MSSLPLNLIDLPHITEAIAESFSFNDLLSCIHVNRAWYDAFIPLLWTDVITFRKSNFDVGNNTPEYHQALIKNAHHIRAITCQLETLPTLLECQLDNLVEVNFVVDFKDFPRTPIAPGKSTQGLDDLSALVAHCCPRLRAVSIENFSLIYDSEVQDLRSFVDFLDHFPNITCLFISLNPKNLRPKSLVLSDIFDQRMARVQSSKITSLVGRYGMELTRSKRGLPVIPSSGQPSGWPGRESPCKEYWTECNAPRILPNVSRGRWEHDAWMYPMTSWAVAVLENDTALEICLPTNRYSKAQVLLDRYPALTRLRGGRYVGILGQTLPQLPVTLPHLRELEWVDLEGCIGEFQQFLDNQVEMSCLDLHGLTSGDYELILQPLILSNRSQIRNHFLRHALVDITIKYGYALPLAHLLELLTLCPNLQSLKVQCVSFDGTEQGVDQSWICSRLREMDLFLEQKKITAQGTEHVVDVAKVAHGFMAQLGTLHLLQELVLRVNNPWRCSVSPFLDLSVGTDNGLGQLSGLSRMEKFTVSGLVHNVGAEEIKWMATHWPRLSAIEIPIHGPIDGVSGYAQLVYAQSEGFLASAFEDGRAKGVLCLPLLRDTAL
ncbi:hypothetical protein BGZ93_006418 [Podila epicladia]|nr:hypothetical protein BGZ93_006418 [Podila epicladia]